MSTITANTYTMSNTIDKRAHMLVPRLDYTTTSNLQVKTSTNPSYKLFRCKSDEFNFKTIETANKERHKQNLFKQYNLDAYKSRFGKQKRTMAFGESNQLSTTIINNTNYNHSSLVSPKNIYKTKLPKQAMTKKSKHVKTTIDLRSLSREKSG